VTAPGRRLPASVAENGGGRSSIPITLCLLDQPLLGHGSSRHRARRSGGMAHPGPARRPPSARRSHPASSSERGTTRKRHRRPRMTQRPHRAPRRRIAFQRGLPAATSGPIGTPGDVTSPGAGAAAPPRASTHLPGAERSSCTSSPVPRTSDGGLQPAPTQSCAAGRPRRPVARTASRRIRPVFVAR